MKKHLILSLLLLPLAIGCDKPTDEECRKAVDNIRKIYGTANSEFGADPEAAVRSCKGNASKSSVMCMLEAKSVEDLKKCEGDAADQFIKEEAEAERKKREEWEQKQEKEKTEGE